MKLLERVILKELAKEGSLSLELFVKDEDYKTIEIRKAVQCLMDKGFVVAAFVNAKESCDMTIDITMAGYDFYIKDNVKG